MTAEKASGAHPEGHDYHAPLLKRRPRASGPDARLFVTPAKDVKDGYRPKSQAIPAAATELEAAFYCRKWAKELDDWREKRKEKKPLAVKHDIGWLIDRYLGDPLSSFRNCREKTRRCYEKDCKIIRADCGTDTIAGFNGERILTLHRDWGRPVPVLGLDGCQVIDPWGNPVTEASTPQRQRHAIVMLRILAKHAVIIKADGAKDFRDLLSEMEFPVPKPREVAPTLDHVEAIVKTAEEAGFLSHAITTQAQFDLIERRIHIIGYWENRQWVAGWEWNNIEWRGDNPSWRIRYFQNKVGLVLREFDLKTTPKLLSLLQSVPESERWGAVIKTRRKGRKDAPLLPWRERHYADVFRAICTKAGVPDIIRSMDMRAGGATEADAIKDVSDRALQDAGGWNDPNTPQRYRRNKQRNAQNVVQLRQAARTTREQ